MSIEINKSVTSKCFKSLWYPIFKLLLKHVQIDQIQLSYDLLSSAAEIKNLYRGHMALGL